MHATANIGAKIGQAMGVAGRCYGDFDKRIGRVSGEVSTDVDEQLDAFGSCAGRYAHRNLCDGRWQSDIGPQREGAALTASFLILPPLAVAADAHDALRAGSPTETSAGFSCSCSSSDRPICQSSRPVVVSQTRRR